MSETSGLSATSALSSSQLRRAFLPGLIAAVGLHAYLPATIATRIGRPLGLNANVIFLIELTLYGFLITSGTTPIIYAYEGFRVTWLTRLAKAWHVRKADRYQTRLQELHKQGAAESERAQRLRGYLADFPIKAEPRRNYSYEVERPTRVGNLIASYELYPERVYGVDGVYFWYHLTFLAPKESRDDVDEKITAAESVLLSSAAGGAVALAALLVLLGRALGSWFPAIARFPAPVSLAVAWETLGFGAIAFVVFYRLSWPAYRAVRDSFRTMVDLAMPAFRQWLDDAPTQQPSDLVKKADIVAEYLSTLVPHRRPPKR